MTERSNHFTESARLDIEKVVHTRLQIGYSVVKKLPLDVSIVNNHDCSEVLISNKTVLTVVNSNAAPVTPTLDTVALSTAGLLDVALDFRPFMLSGSCPTSMLWCGTDPNNNLSDADVMNAFKYWIRYVFGLSFNPETRSVENG